MLLYVKIRADLTYIHLGGSGQSQTGMHSISIGLEPWAWVDCDCNVREQLDAQDVVQPIAHMMIGSKSSASSERA
jgi:hypothetical protein